jgi:hypothetical protein
MCREEEEEEKEKEKEKEARKMNAREASVRNPGANEVGPVDS